jgi:hypothetical protein
MLAVLGGLADVEGDLIGTCTAEGRSRAKALGHHMGGPSLLQQLEQQKGRPGDVHRVLRCKNWRTAIMSGYPPSVASPVPHDLDRDSK